MFYRVENADHIGPYQDSYLDSVRARMEDSHEDAAHHPSPEEGGYYPRKDEICAFRDMRRLFAWFGGWLPLLIQEGYRVVKVDGLVKFEDSFQVVIERWGNDG